MSWAKDELIELLRLEFSSLEELGTSLRPEEWYAGASLPGWVVLDVYSHIIGTESMLEGSELPETPLDVTSFGHVHNEIGSMNETWIESLADLGPDQIMAEFRRVTTERLDTLAAMSNEDFEVETPTPVGLAPYWRFMQIRIFDCWMHEQDVRESLEHPGHESGPCAEAALDEVKRALGFIVGKKAGAPQGSSVTFELTGPVTATIHVLVGERAEVVDALPGPATTTITLSSSLFMRLAGGRTSNLSGRLGSLSFDGDLELAQCVITNLGFTI